MQIDNFQQLYELALKLIDADLAYVCHMTADELKGIDSPDSPWRNRPKEETHALFRDMKNGKIAEGQVKDFPVTVFFPSRNSDPEDGKFPDRPDDKRS